MRNEANHANARNYYGKVTIEVEMYCSAPMCNYLPYTNGNPGIANSRLRERGVPAKTRSPQLNIFRATKEVIRDQNTDALYI